MFSVLVAPIALKSHKIGVGKTVTSHPVVGDEMKEAGEKSLLNAN